VCFGILSSFVLVCPRPETFLYTVKVRLYVAPATGIFIAYFLIVSNESVKLCIPDRSLVILSPIIRFYIRVSIQSLVIKCPRQKRLLEGPQNSNRKNKSSKSKNSDLYQIENCLLSVMKI
jgi:hypothetical protein